MNPLKNLVPSKKFYASPARVSGMSFILGCPRSGTTLLRTMLAGHPDLLVPPELGLLDREDFGPRWVERPDVASDMHRVAEIHSRLVGHGRDNSIEQLKDLRSIHAVYGELKRLAGGRKLIDKTPRYSIDPVVLSRAEDMFEEPLYVWITRHPAGVVHSWNGLFPMFFWGGRDDEYGRNVMDLVPQNKTGELTWQLCNGNIESFLANVPDERQLRVKYEDVVGQPAQVVARICEFLGVPYHEGTLTPFDGDPKKMVDIRGGGDLRFGTRNEIVPELADSWVGNVDTTQFDEETKALALRLGYEV